MSDFPVYRARSSVCLPRSRSVERLGKVGTLTRVSSVPSLDSIRVGDDKYRPSTMFKYRRDYDLLDDHWHDKWYFHTPFHWQTYRYAARRYYNTDPIPNPWPWEYGQFESRYKWYSDWLNPTYWRRHRDPNYDRPLWNPVRPWKYDAQNVARAVRMYREGLVDFKTLDKYWINPSSLDRKAKDYHDIYLPAGYYGAKRYYYSWN
uniref:Uncharacterized protein n=1 Tax=Plectus sambesii TaxID=2011161 RepID=A0A914VXG9_9BILA